MSNGSISSFNFNPVNFRVNVQPKDPAGIKPASLAGSNQATQPAATDSIALSTAAREEQKELEREKLIRAQYQVMHNPAYKPRGGKTFCNMAVNSTLKKIGIPVEKVGIANKEGQPYTANVIAKNLAKSAKDKNGYWIEVKPKQAQELANDGIPVVGAQINRGHGHVVTVSPSEAEYDSKKGPLLNNIGVENKVTHAKNCFTTNPVHYYAPRNLVNPPETGRIMLDFNTAPPDATQR